MKKQWQFSDYMVVIIIVLILVGFCRSCDRDIEKSQQAEIEAAYSEGYEAGYHDGENGNPYNDVR